MASYKCPFCAYVTKRIYILRAHIHEFHADAIADKCPACGKIINGKKKRNGLLKHIHHNLYDKDHVYWYWLLRSRYTKPRNAYFYRILVGEKYKQRLEVNDDD